MNANQQKPDQAGVPKEQTIWECPACARRYYTEQPPDRCPFCLRNIQP